jgi:hypothetical protein
MDRARLEAMLAELPERNRDNVTRTESYLELYTYTREEASDLPWLLMAHLVSRNGGYMMTDVAESIARDDGVFSRGALEDLFLFLERANYLIFHDAWHHVLLHLLGRAHEATPPRVPRFMSEAWTRYEADARSGAAAAPTPEAERRLVCDLVTNEQNFIERRVVHNARFAKAAAMVAFFESIGREAPIVLPDKSYTTTVGGFASLERRIATGWRIFDERLADRAGRARLFEWATAHPHTGSRAAYGGRSTRTVREAWPVGTVESMWPGIHAPPEPDPLW